ncbi:unnamed protein product [Aspergillus oryzae]|uniref:Unnamed protein product n=1 Tax=Aspergillus oryzae var. brunneus TaxID=332754 RepID=A0ABQ6KE41_ASPOZ|nr:unnamed protein product [Aspergillus oryzae]GMF83837.1 unnamed protein product [Aspergillus oryzae]GMG42693.1 unnamed protein product [Aspergillus oryzae var. brunneus]
MWLLYFVNAFQSSITGNLSAYVTSGFESHSLIPTISVVSSVMSAATYMPLAKILNLWDRSIGFLVMVLFSILGLVLSATCSNIATASSTTSSNSIVSSHALATKGIKLMIVVLGTFLLAAGLVLFLLPFTIAGSAEDDWASAHIIVMLVVGFVVLIAFGLSERYLAPVPFLPYEILLSRTVLGACLIDVTYQVAYYCWFDYFTSYLQVVYGTSIATAGYISSIFDVVSGVWLFVVGFLIMKTGRFRWLIQGAVPLYLLGVGLMIYFRNPSWSVGYTIMCQVFLAFAGGTMIICQQVAVQAAADHNHVSSALAFLNCFGNIGGAIGGSISGAIWTHTLPDALKRLLPDSIKSDWESIYDDLDVQLSYERGTPERQAIALAYASSQKNMLIAGTAIMALSLIWMFVLRDIKLTKQQSKGILF